MLDPLYTPKPPLGVMPEQHHKELRLRSLQSAINDYRNADPTVVPLPEWYVEFFELSNWLRPLAHPPNKLNFGKDSE